MRPQPLPENRQRLKTLNVNRLGQHLGAEIRGIDLSRPLDDDTFAQVAKAFFDNEVIVFRNQKITPEQQIAFTRRFGVLEQHVRKEHRLEGYPEILIVSNVLNEQGKAIGVEDAGRFWHSDLSYKREPSLLSALYALEVPVKDGIVLGHTDFASTTAAYDALPEDMKQRLQGLKNVHSYRYYREKNIAGAEGRAGARRARGAGARADRRAAEERAGRRVADRAHAPGHRPQGAVHQRGAHLAHRRAAQGGERRAARRALRAHHQARVPYEHHWQAGDLLMWDNAAAQHKANFNYDLPLRRLMHRTTVRGPAVV